MNMKLRKFAYLILSSCIFGLIVNSCNHFTAPTSVWNPNQKYATGSVISAVLPATTAIAGVREITIIGKNFSKDPDSDWVWYDVDSLAVKSVSLGSAADTLVVYRPPNFGSNLYLKVVIPAADSTGKYLYNMEQPVSSSDLSSISGSNFVVVAGGGNSTTGDTMWIASTGYVNELLPDGIDIIAFKDTSYLKPKMMISGKSTATDFAKSFMDMKFGPGGLLYATFNNTNSSNIVYRLDPDSTVPTAYATISSKLSVGYFDFDENGNLYTGNTKGLFLVKPDGTSISVGDYSPFTFVALRVIKDASGNKFVYAANSGGLFKSPINEADGTVGNKIQIYSVASDTGKIIAGTAISSFTVASDGTVFIAATGNASYSLFVLENLANGSGTATPYYHNSSILPTGINQLTWGNDRWLYLNTGSSPLHKMGIATENGTPLHGVLPLLPAP
jgi:hypothetical protein